MQCYTELVPPTAVTHAVSLPFLGPHAANLVVAKTSLLQVFALANAEKLVLVGEYQLAGTITALAPVKTLDTKSGGQALLLAFRHAKLSLIEWDPENYRTSTISIHYYEADNVPTNPFGPDLSECDPILTVDPSSRCAALKFGARQLAILPFTQHADDLAGEEEEDGYHADHTAATLQNRDTIHENRELEQTPYKASFVLPLTALDPSLSHTIHMAFLHEYREPTVGILSSSVLPSASLLDERKDVLTYNVYTLDLEQRASTNLITLSKLPSTLWKVISLPLPIGGALLVGMNELIHVDQSGKANGTAVNEFAKLESDFGMVDQSHLDMKLESCSVDTLDSKTGELLLVLQDGTLATVNFQTMGRSINSLVVSNVPVADGGAVVTAAPSCISRMDNSKIFVGSEDGPSSLIAWSRPLVNLTRKRSHAQMLAQNAEEEEGEGSDEEEEEDGEDDDDLYDAAPETKKRALSSRGLSSMDTAACFTLQDVLPSIGPLNDVCIGQSGDGNKHKLQLLVGSGRERSSRLTCMHRDILPQFIRGSGVRGAKGVWSIRTNLSGVSSSRDSFDNLLFVYDGQYTKPYDIVDPQVGELAYVARDAPEFEQEGETIEVGTLAGGTIIVQCRRSEVRTYDSNLALSSIVPMVDDETDEEFNVVHLSFCDPFLLVTRDNSSIQVLHVQGKEIEPLEGGAVFEKKWLSGCVYSGGLTNYNPAMFLLNAEGAMEVLDLPTLQPLLTTQLLPHLPPVLSADSSQRRAGTKEALTELLVADLGHDDIRQPYLIVRTSMDDVVIYEPFHFQQPATDENTWHTGLRFRKLSVPYIPKYNEQISERSGTRPPALRTVRLSGYSAVTIPGAPPCLLLKEHHSLPKILEIRQPSTSTAMTIPSPLNRAGCSEGFLMLGADDDLLEFQLPKHTWYGTGWSIDQVALDQYAREVRHLAYHETRGMFAVATYRNVDFHFAEEDGRHQEQDDISLRPQVPQYSVHLVSAKTYKTLDTYDMPYQESTTALKIMPLEVSENTHEQQLRIVVATASQRGEDMPAKGAVTVFNILDVVPEPNNPESGYKLQVVAREETRGAVTAIAPCTGGFIITAQGQKIMIRGLKEDGSCLPVAFLDAQCHTNTIKTLTNKGMWLVGDAWKGLWFGGFTEEPYKLIKLATTPTTKMEVMATEFLPFDRSLYVLVADANMDLHVLQYDPENPKTQNGMRLLHKSTFHLGHFPTTMTLLPSTLAPFAEQQVTTNGTSSDEDFPRPTLFYILTTTLSGSIGLITPLDESAYRRMSTLQTHLTSILEHAAGLNPRAYRAIEGEISGGAKGIVDGSLVSRISELGAAKKADILSRSGADAWSLRSDLEIVCGGGLGYL